MTSFQNNNEEKEMSIGEMIGYFSILVIICIISFLVAKYIVRDSIGWEKPPVDVSERF